MATIENLNIDELEKVNGGLIVEVPFKEMVYVIVDENRKGMPLLYRQTLGGAEYAANMYGVSQEVISREEYQNRFHVYILSY